MTFSSPCQFVAQRLVTGGAQLAGVQYVPSRSICHPPMSQPEFVVPASWHGSSPFVEAKPSDGELRPDWWKLYDDPFLDRLEEQAMAANPDLQAAAERFVQARDMMMKARSQYFPRVGLGFGASDNRASDNALFLSPGYFAIRDNVGVVGGLASWEPDFWSALRNATRVETLPRRRARRRLWPRASQPPGGNRGELFHPARLRRAGWRSIPNRSMLYKQSLDLVKAQFAGAIASALDVARVESLLFSTETKLAQIQGQRQVTEQAIAILVNMAPASFTIEPVDDLRVANFTIPQTIPSTLLERRPDIAGMERQMAQANRAIGIARAAFYP